MKLYDEVITAIDQLCRPFPASPLPAAPWQEAGRENLVFRQDMAYELGGSGQSFFALGTTAVTEDASFVPRDELLCIGPDLSGIHRDTHYARIALVRVKPGTMTQGSALYDAVKKLEFVRYHVSPQGFMIRVSRINGRESARVSREALNRGLSFSHVGTMMLRQFHKNPSIQAVRLIFVTDPGFPFQELQALTRQTESITKALDHILSTGMTDCGTCKLQPICDQVEGMKELHFGLANHP